MLLDFIEEHQNKSHGFYHCKDPRQVSMKVTVKCKSFGDVQKESAVVGWQQKLFSVSELDLYSKYTLKSGSLECKFQNQVAAILASGKTCGHISTHIHGQEHLVASEISREVLSPQPPLSRLASSCSVNRFTDNEEAVSVLHENLPASNTLESAVRALSLSDAQLFTVVVNIDDVEIEICRVQWDSSGNLSLYPDLNSGPASYRIYGGDGTHVIGEYWLELCSPDADLSTPDKFVSNRAVLKQARAPPTVSSSAPFVCPSLGQCFVMYYGQLVSARGFDNSNIFLEYTIDLPAGWTSSDASVLSAVTQRCSADPVANFSFPIHAELVHNISAAETSNSSRCSWQTPRLRITVLSRRRSGVTAVEGHCHLSLPARPGRHVHELAAGRPVAGLSAEMARFFIGTSVSSGDGVSRTMSRQQGDKLNRFPLTTVCVGSVRVEMNCLMQNNSPVDVGMDTRIADSQAVSTTSMMRVLKAFTRARARMLEAKQLAVLQTGN